VSDWTRVLTELRTGRPLHPALDAELERIGDAAETSGYRLDALLASLGTPADAPDR
jgi:hypothetical protein